MSLDMTTWLLIALGVIVVAALVTFLLVRSRRTRITPTAPTGTPSTGTRTSPDGARDADSELDPAASPRAPSVGAGAGGKCRLPAGQVVTGVGEGVVLVRRLRFHRRAAGVLGLRVLKQVGFEHAAAVQHQTQHIRADGDAR